MKATTLFTILLTSTFAAAAPAALAAPVDNDVNAILGYRSPEPAPEPAPADADVNAILGYREAKKDDTEYKRDVAIVAAAPKMEKRFCKKSSKKV
ncbi:hypothetical protein V8F33_011130 [Rhypophila sp. PSN 637]